jgi:hypothetical protein
MFYEPFWKDASAPADYLEVVKEPNCVRYIWGKDYSSIRVFMDEVSDTTF